MPRPMPEVPGLQAERTALSWERSSFGMIAGGAILLFRQSQPMTAGRAVLATTALLLALLVIGLGRRRKRRIRNAPPGTVPDAGVEVRITGWSVAALAAGAILLVVF